MAEHLASIFDTEKDRVNCPFFFKIDACHHGHRCSRLHNRSNISPALLLSNMSQRPDMITPGVDARGQPLDPYEIQENFEELYGDIFEELSKFGEIESLNVCDNPADHMIDNVYVQFKEEDQAAPLCELFKEDFTLVALLLLISLLSKIFVKLPAGSLRRITATVVVWHFSLIGYRMNQCLLWDGVGMTMMIVGMVTALITKWWW